MDSEIKTFYKDKTIFITGASGFVGRATIEKLLRVTQVHLIYVLIRPKRGKEIRDRIDSWASDPLFEVLLKSQPNALQKVLPIAGDCLEPNLGISLADRKILTEQVQLVVHSAASVKFTEPLHFALDLNTRATRLMLQLAKEMKHLESFVYVSTAFSNSVIHHIKEHFYPGNLNCSVDKVLQLREMLDEKVFDEMAPALMGKFPNTYTYSKALSEQLIQTESEQLPVCVLRPSSIVASDKEPIPGWIDNLYGPMALIYGIAFGILRVVSVNPEIICNCVPVDGCVNMLLSCCWKTAQLATQGERQSPPTIYNYTLHPNNQFTVDHFIDKVKKQRDVCPLENSIWYPFVRVISTPWLYKLAIFFYHLVPGFILDMLLRLQGKKPRLMELYKKIHKTTDALEYFYSFQLSLDVSNTDGLWKSLSKADQQLFPFDLEFFNWDDYFPRACRGMRVYLGKQDPSEESIERAIKRLKRQRICHRILQISLACIPLAIGRWLLILWR